MKTDAKTMAEVLRKVADNLDNGVNSISGIQFKNAMGAWIDKGSLDIDESVEYRIKPKTIIVNGVEIPKPLDVSEINPGGHYYFMPCLSNQLCIAVDGYHGQKFEYKHLYKTEEEAIEASKKLFGIE